VPSCDARWMLELMAVRIARAEATRRAQLGVSERDADRAVDVLGAALAGARLTRAECVDRLAAAGLPVAGQAAYHLLGAACRRGVVAMAPEVGAEQTFVLLDDWAPGHRAPERDEALAEIALRFVRGHGPVRRLDLAGWTGLTLADVDRGLAACGDVLRRVAVDGVDMIAWEPALPGAGPDAGPGHDDVGHRALPGFDEFLLGYKDRSLQLDPADAPTIVPGGNGMFRSTLVRAGRVVGTWRRIGLRAGRPPAAGKRLMVVEATPFEALPARDRARFEEALAGWGAFLEVDGVDVRWPV